jgi:hypothetical protein
LSRRGLQTTYSTESETATRQDSTRHCIRGSRHFKQNVTRGGTVADFVVILEEAIVNAWKQANVLKFYTLIWKKNSVSSSIPGEARFFSSPQLPARLWGPPSLLPNGYQGRFPRRQSGNGVNLTTHLHLVPRSRMVEPNLYSPICLHGIVLNFLSMGTTLLCAVDLLYLSCILNYGIWAGIAQSV